MINLRKEGKNVDEGEFERLEKEFGIKTDKPVEEG